jgi:hypothetical protein
LIENQDVGSFERSSNRLWVRQGFSLGFLNTDREAVFLSAEGNPYRRAELNGSPKPERSDRNTKIPPNPLSSPTVAKTSATQTIQTRSTHT